MGCWRSWRCQPQGHRLTSLAQTQKFWGSGRKSWCRSPGMSHFPVACIPWCGKDTGLLVQMSSVFISRRTNTMSPDVTDARWPSLNRTLKKMAKMITSFLFFYYKSLHTFTAAALQVHISNLPVSIGSDLFNSRLPACQEHLRIGHIEEVILHINRWGWILPWLKDLALLRQSNFLLTKEDNRNSDWKSTWFLKFHALLWMRVIWEHTRHFSARSQDPETQREAETSPSKPKKTSGQAETWLGTTSQTTRPSNVLQW